MNTALFTVTYLQRYLMPKPKSQKGRRARRGENEKEREGNRRGNHGHF